MKKSVFSALLALVIAVLICVSCRSSPNEREPARIVDSPVEITDRPAQIVERPAEVTEISAQITDRPAQITDRPVEITERPAQILDRPVEITDRPAQFIERPVEITEISAQITDRPVEIAETPSQLFADPITVDARARAQAARQQAIDFETPAYFPSDWEAVEAQFLAANNAAAFNAATAAYNELSRKTIPLYAQAREDEIMAARDELIGTGLTLYFPEYLRAVDEVALEALDQYEAGNYLLARDTAAQALSEYEDMLLATRVFFAREEVIGTGLTMYFPEYLLAADEMALEALDQYEAGNYLLARNTAAQALNEYEDMLLAVRVFLAWEEIIDRGFVPFDRDNFLNAENFAITAIDEFEAGNRNSARANAREAELSLNTVLLNGWMAFARHRRATASGERELALAERADIASRETFREGEDFLILAERFFAAGRFRDSALNHVEAEAMYAISRIETRERRLRAEEAIRMAEEAIEQSIEVAIEAERVIEGGSR